jgi:hypothetical protein
VEEGAGEESGSHDGRIYTSLNPSMDKWTDATTKDVRSNLLEFVKIGYSGS